MADCDSTMNTKSPQQSVDELAEALDHFGATALAIKAERDALKALNAELLDALADALPFVEDCERAPEYKPGVVKKHIKHIRSVIEKASPISEAQRHMEEGP